MKDEFLDKIKSINFGQKRHRQPKITTDVHDTHDVDITEHWEDRQDVTVRPKTVTINISQGE